ncbi:unnamed protein product [Calypogeia fissa]
MGYLDAQEGANSRTAFRTAEKLYKRYKNSASKSRTSKNRRQTVPPTDLSQVLDFDKYAEVLKDRTSKVDGVSLATGAPLDAPVFVIDGHPGFYFIPRALSVEEQFYWIRESVTSFPQPPNRTNHNTVYGPISDLWSHAQEQHVLVEDSSNDLENLLGQREIGGPHDDGETDENYENYFTAASTSEDIPTETPYAQEDVDSQGDAHTSWHYSVTPASTVKDNALMARVVHEKPEEGCTKWRFVSEIEAGSSLTPTSSTKLITAKSLVRKLRWATIGQQFDWGKKCYNTMLPYKRLPEELCELAARLAEPAMNGEKFLAQGAIVNYYGPDDMLGGHIDDMEADWSKPIVSISLGCKAVFLLGGTTREDAPQAMFLRSGDVVLMADPARGCFHGVPRIFDDPSESEIPDFSTQANFDAVAAGPFLDYIKKSRININVRQVF